jgi:hypothetical protein
MFHGVRADTPEFKRSGQSAICILGYWKSDWNRTVLLVQLFHHQSMKRSWSLGVAAALGSCITTVTAQNPPEGASWLYNLIDGSTLVDDCPICDRVPIVEPIRGTFELRLKEPGPLFTTYTLDNINFTNSGNVGRNYQVSGNGVLRIGGELAVTFDLYLEVYIDNGSTNRLCYFGTNWVGINRPWPMFQGSAEQTNGTPAQQYHLDLNTAPFREIWYSTGSNFTAGISNQMLSNGDLLSNKGRQVKSNAQLTSHLGLMPPAPDLGLKDFDILPGGEIAFSIEQSVWSESLGRTLHPGDLVSAHGAVLRTNQSLIASFMPQTTDDVGLAAVKVIGTGETWFSIQTNFYSKALNTIIYPGDLLSDSGIVIRSNAQLISRFKPMDPGTNVGLKAVYVWPGGEIWFCTESGFRGGDGADYSAGDMLSDQGYLVYRAAELVSAFAPNVTTNLVIDGLWIVTDAVAGSAPPKLGPLSINAPQQNAVSAVWQGSGHVFQLERATNLTGLYMPASPITPDNGAVDVGALTNFSSSFYRVHQW